MYHVLSFQNCNHSLSSSHSINMTVGNKYMSFFSSIKLFYIMLVLLLTAVITNSTKFTRNESALLCRGRLYENVTLSAYYPLYADEADRTEKYLDANGNKLRTLQDYIDNREDYITLSMAKNLNVPYKSKVCIPEMNGHYGRYIEFQVRDFNEDLDPFGYSRAEICVRSEIDSYDLAVNRIVSMYFTEY